MSLNVYSKNKMLNHLLNDIPVYAAGMTSELVDSEIATGRKVISFSSALGGKILGQTLDSIDVLAGTTISHIGLFNSEVGGDLLGVFSIATPETFSNDGKLDITGLEISLV